MHTRSIEVVEERDVGRVLAKALQEIAGDSVLELERIRREVKKARDAAQQGSSGAAKELMQSAWADYTETLSQRGQPLFAEYVDLLGGLALRDTGFDEGICRIADELVRSWVPMLKVDWDSLTIPAYREALRMTPARIIRLGFPEWTDWALPLTAHEFGHVAARCSEGLAQCIGPQQITGGKDEQIRRAREGFAADVIATYAMGPAYACAAILLRFDPWRAFTEQAEELSHAKRASIIFYILERMDKNDATGPYQGIIQRLQGEWQSALEQGTATGDSAKLASQQSKLEGWLAKERETWVDRLWEYLDKRRGPIYSTSDWVAVKAWTEGLHAGDAEIIEVNGTEGLRDVLNAAWNARVENSEKTEEIYKTARALWVRIQDAKRSVQARSLASTRTVAVPPPALVRPRPGGK